MSLEELRKAYEAATPGEWEEGNGLIYGQDIGDDSASYLVCDVVGDPELAVNEQDEFNSHFITLAHNTFPSMLKAVELLSDARNLIAEAMGNHIYNEADGEVPGEDCQYAAFLKEADAVLKGVENA